MPSRKSSRKPAATPPRRPAPALFPTDHEIVDPRWLLKALAVTAVVAIFCAWLALCGLYYQGSWQLVLRPDKSVAKTPAVDNIPFEDIRFDASETGQPRLTGWWIPAAQPPEGTPHPELQTPARYGAWTILYLHDGTGSLSDTLPTLALLHGLGINVFAIDYRGFGQSDSSGHPSSSGMNEDASAAFDYLTGTRHLPADHIFPYGVGLGASLAAAIASRHQQVPALILDNPDPDPTATAIAAHPSGIVPIRLLYHEHFGVDEPLRTLATPKLLLAGGPNARPTSAQMNQLQSLYRSAAPPSIAVMLPREDFAAEYRTALTRFLDQYLPQTGLSR